MRVYVTDGSSVCLLLQNLLCMFYVLHCFKCKASWAVWKNSSCRVLDTELCFHSGGKKTTA